MSSYDIQEIIKAFYDTLFLLGVTSLFIVSVGLLLGFVLFFTEKGVVLKDTKFKKICHMVTGFIVDTARSIPFIILMILLIPVTIILVGTMIGAKAALPALIISAVPFYARVVYMALRDIPKGHIEALEAMGASRITIFKYLTKEALPGLVSGLTVTVVTLVGFITSAGAIGAGGLGDLAKRRAFSGQYDVVLVSIAIILVIVFSIQITGDYIAKKIDRR
ncbi:methionine ABC transporter permease [Acholeplasma laidlawii]|uniref:methionine ABC transporter permease n=1 Tax=Acholeplasma laidlawii TaxID=2148 RepID=UPI0021F69D73|nr:methionine ABC transporter permease [Acholeplasma laidlawii]